MTLLKPARINNKHFFSSAYYIGSIFVQPLVGCCQPNANQSPNIQMIRISRRQLAPFGHGRSAVLLEYFAWGEMTFEIKMIVDRGMNGREFLQGFHVPEFRHRAFPSTKRLV